MFLYYLNMKEKMAFIQLAREMVTVDDDQIDEYEQDLLAIMSNEMQISVDNTLSIEFNIDQLAGTFDTKRTQKICFAELYSLALSNKEFHNNQKDLLIALSDRFRLDEDEINEIKEWVKKVMSLYQQGTEILIN